MDKQAVEYYSVTKRDKLLIPPIAEMNLKCIMLGERSHPWKAMSHESIHSTFWKRQISRDRKQISGGQGLRVLGGVEY